MYCGNNELDARLKENGGHAKFGKPSECLRKGYALGYNAPIGDTNEFLRRWTERYRPHVKQSLYCGDDAKVPPGYDVRGTLPQCMQRGFGLGSLARAAKIRKQGGLDNSRATGHK